MRKVGSNTRLTAGAITITAVTLLALFASSLAGAAKVEPIFLAGASNGGKDCEDNDGNGQTWSQLKVDPNADGVYSAGPLTVTISNTQNDKTFDWSSNIGVDAVIAKGGADGSYLYRYDPPTEEKSDSGLTTPGVNGISHISFCYDVDPTGSLTVIKKVVNDDDGSAESDDWTMNVAGPEPSSFAGADDPGTTKTVAIGSYTVTESGGPPGYALSYSGDCDANGNVSVAANEKKTCTLTNDDNDRPPPPDNGTIIVEKQLLPDGYQPPQGGFVFSGAIDAILGDGESESLVVEPGTYSVTESLAGRDFWDLVSIDCDDDNSSGSLQTLTATYEVDPGETVKCTFTNVKRSLIVVKKITDPQGATESFAFDASYDQDGFTLTDGQQNVSEPLLPGPYSVTESVPEGWELESATCDNGDEPDEIDLPASSTVTCTFTNRKLPETGTIVVEKVTDPSGDETEFDFEFGQDGFTLADGESETFDELDAGTYSVSEDTPEGWELTSATCSDQSPPNAVDLAAGETVTCTFTNTRLPELGTIIVEKQTSPDGAQGSFTFSGDASGTIGDGGQIIVVDLEPGTYASTEGSAAGWLLTSIECDDEESGGNLAERTAVFQLDAGETVKCVFTNAQQTVGKGSIDVQKSANPTSLKEPGGPVQFSVRITNTSNVAVTITNVVDDKFGDLDDSGGTSCFDVPINLPPGAFSSCQFTGQVTGSGGTEHVNVVTASGNDEFGNPLSDSDDARVTITPRLIDLVIVKDATSPTPLNGTVDYSLTVTNKGPDTPGPPRRSSWSR